MALSTKVVVGSRGDGQKSLIANTGIRKSELLIVYDGPVVTHSTRYSIQIDEDKHIEGTPESNAFLNHSCAPNAYVDWNGPFLRALRDIATHEEITCNYLTTDWELHEPFQCQCGAPNCHGLVRGLKYISSEEQNELIRYLPEFLKRKIAELAVVAPASK